MIQLTTAQANNNLAFTLTEKTTVNSPTYLFSFTNDTTETEYTVIAADTSSNTARWNIFSITEGVDDRQNGSVILGDGGYYTYKVYAQTSTTNLDSSLADELVETGIMFLDDSTNQTFVSNTVTGGFVTHNPES